MNSEMQSSLASVVQRVKFDRVERKLYGHDIAAMPILVKPILGGTIPDGIVQPQSEQELVDLVHWARQHRVPLTPRGKATSGYGGVLPVKQGIVVDFYQMRAVQEVNVDACTVTTQPGITWEQLDNQLEKYGLTLRLYPSSYPSSTVGGWLAQGGAGFGSYEYGFFRDNVLSAKVVQPNGEVRVFSGPDLDFVSETEGITGLISEVTLSVQRREEVEVMAAACANPYDFQNLVEAIIKANLPVWSLMFINPKMAELKSVAPLREHNGHAVGHHVALPSAYILTITYRQKDAKEMTAALPNLFASHQANRLNDEIAQHEWENRFKLMMVKRLGPSLVPAEVVIPVENLAEAIVEIGEKVSQPLVKEGVILRQGKTGKPEAVILGFIPSDQRNLNYNLIFALSLSVMKIAEKHGGRAYSTGLYFSKKAGEVLGQNRLEKLRSFKARIDPDEIMNPGKVFDSGLIGSFMQMAELAEPVARPMGNAMNVQVGERPTEAVRDIPADVAWYAYACSQCGYCVDECPQFYGRGWESQSPRGKWYWLREYMEGREQWDQNMVDTFLLCTTCEMCNFRCSAALPIEPSWMKLRGQLIHEEKRMTFPPFEMMAAATQAEGDIWAGYRKDRSNWFPSDMVARHGPCDTLTGDSKERSSWFPEELQDKHGPGHIAKNVYFAGCTASYVENDIAIGTVRLLDAAGVDFSTLGEKNLAAPPPCSWLVSGMYSLKR